MSTVKSKKLQVGTDATSSNNFTIYQPSSPDGTLRIGVGNADNPTEVGRFTSAGYKPATAPAFSAYASATTTCNNGTFTKVNYGTEYYDVGSCYDVSNSRFTPNVAGYYQINANTFINDTMGSNTVIAIGKNGSEWQRGSGGITSTPLYYTASSLIYCNGTTDYIEVFQYQSSGTTKNLGTGGTAQFNGYLVQQA